MGFIDPKRRWRRNNPDKVRASDRRYRERHPDRLRERAKVNWQQIKRNPAALRRKRAATKKWYEAHGKESTVRCREKRLDYKYKTRYGITLAKKREMLAAQPNCAICLTSFVSLSDAHVDHDHKTTVVRMLLCRKCNRLLSDARENLEILRAAIGYLENHLGPC